MDVPLGDKLLHFAEYAVLGFLLLLPLRDTRRPTILMGIAVGVAFAAVDEAVQATVPLRSADPLDFVADVLGLLLGVAAAIALHRRRVRAAGTFM